MKKTLKWITETAVMLALLIALQYFTKPLGQIVTGSCVNMVLAVSALVGGLSSGVTIAFISPVLAYLLGIAPQILTVPAIMIGNVLYVLLLCFIVGKKYNSLVKRAVALVIASLVKFASLYAIVVWLICDVFAEGLLASGTLKLPMIATLSVNFGINQLITALVGGAVALLIVPVLRKALGKRV